MDAANAYFTDYNDQGGRVMRVPLAGGPAIEVVSNQIRPRAISIDSQYVYWTDSLAGLVQRAPKLGGAAEALAPWQHNPEAVEARAEGVYWLNRGNPNDGAILFLASGAVDPVTIVSSQHDSSHLAVDDDEVWWMNQGAQGTLNKVSLDGAPLVQFALIDTPRALTLDATSVYIASAGEIWRTDKQVGPLHLLASPAVAQGLAVDDTSLYWAGSFEGVRKVPVAGGDVTTVAEAAGARDVAVDDTCVFWVSDNGSVWRVAK